jgi:hypothetical protein
MNTKTETRLNRLASLLLVSHPAISFAAFPPHTLTEAEAQAGRQLLIDGRTTAGWCGYKTDKIAPDWRGIDGMLVRVKRGEDGKGAGGGDDLVTTEEFENFDLLLEWKTGG